MITSKWTTQLDQNTALFKQHFGHLDAQALNWKPSADVWSIGQNIHHLITINESYYPVFELLRKGTYQKPFIGKIGFLVSMVENMLLKAVQPDTVKKIKTFPIWEPAMSQIDVDIVQQFEQHQSVLKKEIESCANLVGKNVVLSSPANKNVVYTLDGAFDIITTHELRHLKQAKKVLDSYKEW